jgi:hypothetical protein
MLGQGNKGGIGIRFEVSSIKKKNDDDEISTLEDPNYLFNSESKLKLCFLNVHLAAHQSEVSRRNKDLLDIFEKLKFTNIIPILQIQLNSNIPSQKLFPSPIKLRDHHSIFISGDMNYRINLSQSFFFFFFFFILNFLC